VYHASVGEEYDDLRQQRREYDRQLDQHRRDSYAHGELMGRINQENVTLRERFENRLSALERFRAQATVLGGIGLLLLGALSAAVFQRLIH
jgi:hypothetical protein